MANAPREFALNRLAAGGSLGHSRSQQAPPIETSDNIFDRVSISLYNALRLDPEASVRALVAPDTLPPNERTTLAQSFTKGRKGLESFIISELTNPLVLVGAALSYRWPVLDPSKYRDAASTLKQYERYIPGPLRKLLGLNEQFVGTKIPALASRIPAESANFINKHFHPVGDSIMKWRAAMGRKETVADEIRWAIQSDNTFSKRGLDRINQKIASLNKRRGPDQQLAKLTPKDFTLEKNDADKLVVGAWKKAAASVQRRLSKNPEALARMAKMSSKTFDMHPNVRWIEGGYFPRIAVQNYKRTVDMREKMIQGLLHNVDELGTTALEDIKRYGKGMGSPKTKRLLERKGVLVPDATDLSLLPKGSVSEKALHALSEIRQSNLLSNRPPSYSLKFSPVIASYAHSMGRSYAWSYKGFGQKLIAEGMKVEKAELRLGKGLNKTELLRNLYIPQIMGVTNFDQAMKATEWAGVRQAVWAMSNDPKAMRGVPDFAVSGLRKMLEEDSFWHPRSAGSKISNYFYASTLGLNIGSAAQNLMQPLLTTAPLIGISSTLKGIAQVTSKIPAYYRLRKSGMDEVSALKKLFPEFVKSGGELGALTTEIALKESADIARGGLIGLKSPAAKLRDVLMMPFRSTELFNRLSTFEGARDHARIVGLSKGQALQHATEVVNLTQLWAGGGSTPPFMANWWGPVRQFLTFPAKMAGYVAGSVTPTMTSEGWQLGIGGGFSPGVLGRALTSSTTAYLVAKEFADADISRSLLFGGLPLPEEQSVLSPLPVIPPLVGLVAGGLQDLVTGSSENLKRALPTLLPAGVQMAKLSQVYAPKVAKAMNRGYADTTQTTPEGMVPMFDSRGQLTGYKTATELLLSTIGIPGKLIGPNGDVQTQQLERYFIGQRDRMRELRKTYIDSYLDGDVVAAEKVRNRYMEDYGHGIEIRPQDWEAAEMTRYIPRLERIAKTLPADVRNRFLMVAHTALAGQGERFLGVDPIMFSRPRRELKQLLAPAQPQTERGF